MGSAKKRIVHEVVRWVINPTQEEPFKLWWQVSFLKDLIDLSFAMCKSFRVVVGVFFFIRLMNFIHLFLLLEIEKKIIRLCIAGVVRENVRATEI